MTEDVPSPALHKGQVGTIVAILQEEIFDVEFSDNLLAGIDSAEVRSSAVLFPAPCVDL